MDLYGIGGWEGVILVGGVLVQELRPVHTLKTIKKHDEITDVRLTVVYHHAMVSPTNEVLGL